ncbi:MFS transporter [uncultured Thermanaerothrix sp.]|uniref:MFS transporter n=1 Tax=uncultured Thermanaerothrix sp. TaxID=1195149 RepID=UPI002611B48B|nr:MFS transporter [uncultured Thermanaerothrix sp.]
MKIRRFLAGLPDLNPIQQRNFRNVELDAIAVGLANAAAPFLPVFLTRLGASSFQVGLLSSLPALTGLILALPMGQFLQRQRNIVRWFSLSRMGYILGYGLIGVLSLLMPSGFRVVGILLLWALATIPQTMLSITFSVVMNAVAGPHHRFDLMTRRWSILGVTTSVAVFLIGQLLDRIAFPLNYQVVFTVLGLAGILSYYFSSQIVLPDMPVPDEPEARGLKERLAAYLHILRNERAFLSFVARRFIFLTGSALVTPIFPLYFVRVVHASDGWIATINTAQTAILMVGYFFWSAQSRRRGTRWILLWTTFGVGVYPVLVALTTRVELITLFAGIAGIFQAGLNLVFFDELMKRVPIEYSASFVALAQELQYVSSMVAPVLGTSLADWLGLQAALWIGGAVQLVGFALFATMDRAGVG